MTSRAPNRLAREKSPYLLQHAHNPVDWFPWGDEAFRQARAEQKPIFLSVGYSTCHWCHVMERESFESERIAALLNAHFVSIKVDREERPDVDQVYMAFVQATTGHGGWPMSVWLTPELKPFFGGTYFPPADAPGRAGFGTVLERIAALWRENRSQLEDRARSLTEALRQAERETVPEAAGAGWNARAAAREGVARFARMFDSREGGFGGAPKFPRPVNLEFLLRQAAAPETPPDEAETALGMALHTLRKMAAGGMHDHLGGGFHRYSVDGAWHVPHFEKMLYDQAQLASCYLAAFQRTGEALFAETARGIFDYVARDLTSPEGAFYSAEDADSLPAPDAAHPREGAFYVWTQREIGEALGAEEAALFGAGHGVEPEGNAPPESDPHGELAGQNVLIRRADSAELAEHPGRPEEAVARVLAAAREKLFLRRERRPRPLRDDKVVTAWNGLMIAAFARGAQVLGDAALLERAQRAARFARAHLGDDATGTLRRSWRGEPSAVPGFAADHAALIGGLVELYEADFDPAWLAWARRLQERMDALFGDEARGGYFSSPADDPALPLRLREDYDGAEPAPSSLAALHLLRLGRLLNDDALADRARRTVAAFADRLEAQPFGMPLLLAAAAALERPPAHLVLVAERGDDPGLAALLREARRPYLPDLAVIRIASPAERAFFAARHPMIAALPESTAGARAYLCENFTCRLPVAEPEELRRLLAGSD